MNKIKTIKYFGLLTLAFLMMSCASDKSSPITNSESVPASGNSLQDQFINNLISGEWYQENYARIPSQFPIRFKRLPSGDIMVGYYTIHLIKDSQPYKGRDFIWYPVEVNGKEIKFNYRMTNLWYKSKDLSKGTSLTAKVKVYGNSNTRLSGYFDNYCWHFSSGNIDCRGSIDQVFYKVQ